MNISQNKSRVESCLEKLQKMFLIGISVDVKELDYKQVPPPNSPIDIRFPQNPPNTPKIVIETDLWPCRDEKCNQLIDNQSELVFNEHPERMCPKCGTTRFKP